MSRCATSRGPGTIELAGSGPRQRRASFRVPPIGSVKTASSPHAVFRARLCEVARRLVERLVGELERAPVDAERRARAQVAVREHRLVRVHVLELHEPARLVGADRQQGEVEAAARGEARARVGEVGRVAGVAGEVDVEAGREQRVAAPQRAHAVVEPAARPVLHRREHDLHRALGGPDGRRLPPVELDDVRNARVGEERAHAQRHDVARRSARLPRERAKLARSQWS
jgi:hypothetical protein